MVASHLLRLLPLAHLQQRRSISYHHLIILTTNLAAVVCVCVSVQNLTNFCPYAHFDSKRPENFVRIAKFPYGAFGPLFAFHCPLFFTRNNDLECKSSRFAAVVRRSVADKQLHLNGRNPFSRRSSVPRAQPENVVHSGMQRSRFKPRAGNNIFFIFIVCD